MFDVWVTMYGGEFEKFLRRAHAGEDVGLLIMEFYANSDHEHVEGT
jgi:hypothetical protein